MPAINLHVDRAVAPRLERADLSTAGNPFASAGASALLSLRTLALPEPSAGADRIKLLAGQALIDAQLRITEAEREATLVALFAKDMDQALRAVAVESNDLTGFHQLIIGSCVGSGKPPARPRSGADRQARLEPRQGDARAG